MSSQQAVGLEIADSATSISAYVETSRGPRRRRQRLSAPPKPEEALAVLHDLIVRTIYDVPPAEMAPDTQLPPFRLGVAFWGQLDRDLGTVLMLRQNPSWSGFPLAEALSARLRAPITLETAINAAACGEASCSPGRGEQNNASATGPLLYVHLGREVSAAIIEDGYPLVKHKSSEEQFGHSIVAANGPRCQCGSYGHLTPIASAQSLVRSMIGQASDHDESRTAILEISSGRAEALTAPQVVQLATAGDAIAADILAVALDALSLAISNVVLLLTPGVVMIGGPLTEAGDAFLAPLRVRLALLLGNNAPLPSLQMGSFEPFSSLKGAYALALRGC